MLIEGKEFPLELLLTRRDGEKTISLTGSVRIRVSYRADKGTIDWSAVTAQVEEYLKTLAGRDVAGMWGLPHVTLGHIARQIAYQFPDFHAVFVSDGMNTSEYARDGHPLESVR